MIIILDKYLIHKVSRFKNPYQLQYLKNLIQYNIIKESKNNYFDQIWCFQITMNIYVVRTIKNIEVSSLVMSLEVSIKKSPLKRAVFDSLTVYTIFFFTS